MYGLMIGIALLTTLFIILPVFKPLLNVGVGLMADPFAKLIVMIAFPTLMIVIFIVVISLIYGR